MSMDVSFEHTNAGAAKQVLSRLKDLASHQIGVGVPRASNRDGRDTTIGNADLVYIHTHGVRQAIVRHAMDADMKKGKSYSAALQMYIQSHGSVAFRVPPRPLIEPALQKREDEIAELLVRASKAAVKGEDYMARLKAVGLQAQNIVKEYFEDPSNGWAPNARSTIEGWMSPWGVFYKGKGSDKPLIDTGALRQSIHFTIDGVMQA